MSAELDAVGRLHVVLLFVVCDEYELAILRSCL
jgi:hypothetical protein